MLPTTRPLNAERAYDEIVDIAAGVLRHAEAARAAIPSGMDVDRLVDLHRTLRRARARGEQLAPTPGLNAFARSATGDPDYDIHAAFGGVVATGAAVTDWLAEYLPNDGHGGYIAYHFKEGDFERVVLHASALAPLDAHLAALIAAIRGV